MQHETEGISLVAINVPAGRRPVSGETVALLVRSIETMGLRTPITVRRTGDGKHRLIAGAHRIEAARKLGWQTIPAYVLGEDDTDPERADKEDALWEIGENLHRGELTEVQRAEHFTRWLRLRGEIPPSRDEVIAAWGKASAGDKPAQVAHLSKGGRGNEGGLSASARELGIPRRDAQRLHKIGGMSEVAQREAETLGLANNQSALLKAAAEPPERQVEKLRELADPPIPGPEREVFATLCVQLNEIISAAKKAGLHEFADALKGTRSILDETGKRLFARSEGDAPI